MNRENLIILESGHPALFRLSANAAVLSDVSAVVARSLARSLALTNWGLDQLRGNLTAAAASPPSFLPR